MQMTPVIAIHTSAAIGAAEVALDEVARVDAARKKNEAKQQ